MNVTPIDSSKRSPVAFWLVGGALLILALWGFNHVVQQNARHAATVATRIANQKLEAARITQDERQWKLNLAACGRGNKLRRAIQDNSIGTRDLALQLATSRRVASALELTPALARHDLDVANGYVKLANRQRYLPQIDCAAKWPNPHPESHHQ